MKRFSIILLLSVLFTLTAADNTLEKISVQYFGDIGCAHCDLFEEKVLPSAEEKTGFTAEVSYINVLTKDGFLLCETALAERGYEYTVSPVMIVGNNVYQGNSAVDQGILEELSYAAQHGTYLPKRELPAKESGSGINLAFLPVFLAGLVDGVNPCAFATMLFFLSWIALKGGSKRKIILAGTGFISGVFTAYLLIGLGLFTVFQAAEDLSGLRQVIRYLFSAIAFSLALLSLRDAYLIRCAGKAGAMKLQLPSTVKKRIHRVIRETQMNTGGFLLFIALLVTGVIVSLLELACTGQIYFPTIAYMVQSGTGTDAFFWLLLYNLAFILPLLTLFTLALTGVSHKRISEWFTAHVFKGKIATALLFLLLTAVIWVSG